MVLAEGTAECQVGAIIEIQPSARTEIEIFKIFVVIVVVITQRSADAHKQRVQIKIGHRREGRVYDSDKIRLGVGFVTIDVVIIRFADGDTGRKEEGANTKAMRFQFKFRLIDHIDNVIRSASRHRRSHAQQQTKQAAGNSVSLSYDRFQFHRSVFNVPSVFPLTNVRPYGKPRLNTRVFLPYVNDKEKVSLPNDCCSIPETKNLNLFKMMNNATLALSNHLAIIPAAEDKAALLGSLAPSVLQKPVRVAFVNAHAVNLSHRDPAFLTDLLDCGYLLRDGSGMKILFKILGKDPGLNLNGTDFIPDLIDLYHGSPIALMGTSGPYLDSAAAVITAREGHVVAKIDGFQGPEDYLTLARQTRPALIILAMGMPKQERIASYLSQNLGYPCLIVCGGAILDFMGGKVKRAPALFRKLGLEWIYRLLSEPKRLFGRYVIGNAVFLGRALVAFLQTR